MDGLATNWREERRERLLEGAMRVFTRVGFDKASMDEIASEAGVGKPTLYRYFGGKDDLFAAVFTDALDRLEAQIETVLDRVGDPEARLRDVLAILVPTFREHLVSRQLADGDDAALDQSKRRIFRDRRSRIAACIARALRPFAPLAEAERASHFVIGMIWSGAAALDGSDEVIARDIAAIVLRGIASPPSPRAALIAETRP